MELSAVRESLRGGNMKANRLIIPIAVFAMGTYLPVSYSWAGKKAAKIKSTTEKVDQAATQNAAAHEAPEVNTINEGSKVGQSSQSGGAGANAAAAAALMAACMAPCPKCLIPLCIMSMLAAKQAGHDSGAAAQSANTDGLSDDLKNNLSSNYNQGNASYANGNLKKVQNFLKEKGVTVTKAGVTMPDGSFTPMSAFNSPSAMLNAGIDPDSVDEAKKILTEVNSNHSKLKDQNLEVSTSGGGATAPYPTEEVSDDTANLQTANPFDLTEQQRRDLLNKKTVMLDGEPIGVAGNDIFVMINQAYEKKTKGNQFFDNTAATTPIRLPASTNTTNN